MFRVVFVTASPSSPLEAGNAGENWHLETSAQVPPKHAGKAGAAFLSCRPRQQTQVQRWNVRSRIRRSNPGDADAERTVDIHHGLNGACEHVPWHSSVVLDDDEYR
jgi:hypothetical protein